MCILVVRAVWVVWVRVKLYRFRAPGFGFR